MRKREWVAPLYALLFSWLLLSGVSSIVYTNRDTPINQRS
jgi:hypothetical protein